MAKLSKPSYSAPIPNGARIIEREVKRFARFKDDTGRWVEARVVETGTAEKRGGAESRKPLQLQGFESDCARLSADDRRVREGIRTPDSQSHSLVP